MSIDLSGKCLVEVGGSSCAACVAVMPNCREIAEQFGLKFIKVDIEDNPEIAESFSIDRIPSIILVQDGKEIAKCSGFQPFEILELWVEAKLNS